MNGNFSFGDYFKEGAIELAWELVTRPQADGGYGLDPRPALGHRLPRRRRGRRALARRSPACPTSGSCAAGMEDNYWSHGRARARRPVLARSTIDRGPEYGREGGPAVDEDRYLEIWNLVFMQYERGAVRGKEDFDDPRRRCRRRTSTPAWAWSGSPTLLQGVDNLYEIDEVVPGHRAGPRSSPGRRVRRATTTDDVRLRVVADHVRTALMLIGDGVTPGNEGRGYVLRRLLRRAVRSMRLLGVDEPALPELLPVSRDAMSAVLPRAGDRLRPDLARSPTPRRRRSGRPCAPAPTILDTAVARGEDRRRHRRCPATRRSRCTTPTASRST